MDRTEQRWEDIGAQSLQAAGACLRGGFFRSAVSRAYFAVFSLVTGALVKVGTEPRRVLGTWLHERLAVVAKHTLRKSMDARRLADLLRNMRPLYTLRIDADYVPGRTVDKASAKEAMRRASTVFTALGVSL